MEKYTQPMEDADSQEENEVKRDLKLADKMNAKLNKKGKGTIFEANNTQVVKEVDPYAPYRLQTTREKKDQIKAATSEKKVNDNFIRDAFAKSLKKNANLEFSAAREAIFVGESDDDRQVEEELIKDLEKGDKIRNLVKFTEQKLKNLAAKKNMKFNQTSPRFAQMKASLRTPSLTYQRNVSPELKAMKKPLFTSPSQPFFNEQNVTEIGFYQGNSSELKSIEGKLDLSQREVKPFTQHRFTQSMH